MTVQERLKQLKGRRLIAEIGFIAIGVITPLVMFIIRFELFQKYTASNQWTKIGLIGFIVISVTLGVLFRFTKFRFSSLEYGVLKIVLYVISGLIPAWLLYGFVWLTKHYMDAIHYIFGWIAVLESIAFVVFVPLIMYYDHHVKRTIRKQETIEAIREA